LKKIESEEEGEDSDESEDLQFTVPIGGGDQNKEKSLGQNKDAEEQKDFVNELIGNDLEFQIDQY